MSNINLMTLNVNGLKSFYNRKVLDYLLHKYAPKVLCIQETKCTDSYVNYWLCDYSDYKIFTNSSRTKSGYAGVATMVHKDLLGRVVSTSYPELCPGYEHSSGRIVTTEFDHFVVINVYTVNSGNKDDLRIEWDKQFKAYCIKTRVVLGKPIIILGDLNVCSGSLDHYNWVNALNSGPSLMDYEIEGFHSLVKSTGLVDSHRELHPEDRSYTWFSYQGNSRANNHGYRLDYALVSKEFHLSNVVECTNRSGDNVSDHCPVVLTIIDKDLRTRYINVDSRVESVISAVINNTVFYTTNDPLAPSGSASLEYFNQFYTKIENNASSDTPT